MKYSYKILNIKGIDIEVHFLFLIFILGIMILDVITGLLLIVLFLFVTIHELAHSLVALHFKLKVKRIVLLPIGGVAIMDLKRISPKKEFLVSIAGPLTNFVFVFVFYFLASLLGYSLNEMLNILFSENVQLSFLELLILYGFYANLILGVFNLFVPAFPLDGGRILRALLSWKLGFERGTRISRNISVVISIIMSGIGLVLGNLWLLIIALFVGFGAISEFEITVMNKASKYVKIEPLIREDVVRATPETIIQEAVNKNTPVVFLDDRTYVYVPEFLEKGILRKVRVYKNPRKETLFKIFMEEGEPVIYIKDKGYIFAEDYKKALELVLTISKVLEKSR